jgi:tetratricopeptide (TPR) repeat protein
MSKERKERGPAETIATVELMDRDTLGTILLFDYADALRRVGRCKEAIDIYLELEKAEVPERRKWLVFLYKGTTLKQMGKFAESEKAYIEACKLDPSTVPRVYLAGVLAAQERFQAAIDVLEDGLDRDGDRDEVLLNMALNQRTLGKLKEAKESLESALKLTPSYPEASAVLEDVNAALSIKAAGTGAT